MLSLFLVVAAAQPGTSEAPVVAVVVSSKRAGAEPWAEELAARVHAALKREGAPNVLDDKSTALRIKEAGFSDARKCQGAISCLANLALLLGPKAVVVSIDVGKVGSRLAVHLEATTSEKASLASKDFVASVSNFVDESAVPIALFARELMARLPSPPKPATAQSVSSPDAPANIAPEPLSGHPISASKTKKPDLPVKVALESPLAVAHEPAAEIDGGRTKPGTVPIALGGAAAASLGASVVFAVLAMQDKGAYDAARYELDGQVASRLSQSELDTLAQRGNARFTVALSTAVMGVALGALSTALLVSE